MINVEFNKKKELLLKFEYLISLDILPKEVRISIV